METTAGIVTPDIASKTAEDRIRSVTKVCCIKTPGFKAKRHVKHASPSNLIVCRLLLAPDPQTLSMAAMRATS